MRILILSQVFYPDQVAVSQHLSDLGFYLASKHIDVTVWTSSYSYENTNITFPKFQEKHNVKIHRIKSTKFTKKKLVGRAINFFTFNFIISFKLLFVDRKKFDKIFTTTVPPLLPFFVAVIAKIKSIPFIYWVMDMQPELLVGAGILKEKSYIVQFLKMANKYTIKNANKIIVLDEYMSKYISTNFFRDKNIFTIPLWPIINSLYSGERLANPFRLSNKFANKIVVMYSGNHALVHPLETLLFTALKLKDDSRFLFVFIGGGVRKVEVSNFKNNNNIDNIIQLPYQDRNSIHISLAAADIQVVIMGDGQVGYTHPNKIYGALYIGKPVLYIGPTPSHITDILENLPGNYIHSHGDVDGIVYDLLNFSDDFIENSNIANFNNLQFVERNLSVEYLKNKMLEIVNS